MDELLEKIGGATLEMWLDRPQDVGRMVGRNYATGKEFAVWAYCWGYLGNLGDWLYSLHGISEKREGDVGTLGLLYAQRCREYASIFRATGHMEDLASLLEDAAVGFESAKAHEELSQLSRTLQRYVMQLSFWVDIELPWAEVSELVDKRWHEES